MRRVTDVARPILLDTFCKAGGAAEGYNRAGFDVIGVDIEPQPNYPFPVIQADALAVLDDLVDGGTLNLLVPGHSHGYTNRDIAAYHGSPPCQDYSATRSLHAGKYPRLIGPVRERFEMLGKPYVIENVERAKPEMVNPLTLCGSSFGLGVRRHRLFEVNFPHAAVPACAHHLQPEPVDVTGTGARRVNPRADSKGGNSRKPYNLAHAREVMGIEWMTRLELSEAIPPAMTHWLGAYLLAAVGREAAA